jgi:PAS domain S-box-containing protein
MGEKMGAKRVDDLVEIIRVTETASTRIHGLSDPHAILETLIEEFRKSRNNNLAIFLLNDEGSELSLMGTSMSSRLVRIGERLAGVRSKGLKIRVDGSARFGEVVRDGMTISLPAREIAEELVTGTAPALLRGAMKAMRYEGRRSIITPISKRGKAVGALAVSSPTLADHFVPSVESFARHVSTALERADEELRHREAEERLRIVTNATSDYVAELRVTPEGLRVVSITGNFSKVTGYEVDEVKTASDWARVVHPDDFGAFGKLFQEVASSGQAKELEFRGITKEGKVLWLHAYAQPLWDPGRTRVVSVIAAAKDVTRRRDAEEQLRSYSERLEEEVDKRTRQLKDSERMATIGQTTTMVGHDLRNPLQAIVNNLYLAKKGVGGLPSSEREIIEKSNLLGTLGTIEEQIGYMNKIVSDLQDFARPISIKPSRTDLAMLIQDVLSSIEVPESVETTTQVCEGGLDLDVDTDSLKRVLTNLFTNSIQAMPRGGHLVIGLDKDPVEAILSVTDTGEGIPEEKLEEIFQPLFTTKARGQGFGLPVCKRLVEAQGGTISVESVLGKGSTFTVRLPLQVHGT